MIFLCIGEMFFHIMGVELIKAFVYSDSLLIFHIVRKRGAI